MRIEDCAGVSVQPNPSGYDAEGESPNPGHQSCRESAAQEYCDIDKRNVGHFTSSPAPTMIGSAGRGSGVGFVGCIPRPAIEGVIERHRCVELSEVVPVHA